MQGSVPIRPRSRPHPRWIHRKAGSWLRFEFMPRMLDRPEVRAPFGPVRFFQARLGKAFLYGVGLGLYVHDLYHSEKKMFFPQTVAQTWKPPVSPLDTVISGSSAAISHFWPSHHHRPRLSHTEIQSLVSLQSSVPLAPPSHTTLHW